MGLKTTRGLRRGDVIEVKSATEILATLDEEGALEGLPFMTMMLRYCGHRFVVDKRAEKICDTIKTYGSRRIRNTVLLKDLRCDGSGHDGCQAECRLFWKESWLRRISPREPPFLLTVETDRSNAARRAGLPSCQEDSGAGRYTGGGLSMPGYRAIQGIHPSQCLGSPRICAGVHLR